MIEHIKIGSKSAPDSFFITRQMAGYPTLDKINRTVRFIRSETVKNQITVENVQFSVLDTHGTVIHRCDDLRSLSAFLRAYTKEHSHV